MQRYLSPLPTTSSSSSSSPTNLAEVSPAQRQFEDHIRSLTTEQRNESFRRAVFGNHLVNVHRFLQMPGSNTIGLNGILAAGYTPLQWAAENCMVHMATLLVQRGADPSVRVGLQCTALQLAVAQTGNDESGRRATTIAKLLIKYLVRRAIATKGKVPFGLHDLAVLKREKGPLLEYYSNCIKMHLH